MCSRAVCPFLILLLWGSLSFAQVDHTCTKIGNLPGLGYTPPIYVRMSTSPDTYWLNQEVGVYVAWGLAPSDTIPERTSRSSFSAPPGHLDWYTPLAATQSAGEIYVVGRSTEGGLVHLRFDPRTRPIANWHLIPGGGITEGGVAAASEEPLPDGTLSPAIDYFAVTPDGRVMTNRFLPSTPIFAGTLPGTWSGWTEVPGGGIVRSTPVAVQYRGNLHLIARGMNDGIWENVRSSGEWSGWFEIPGGGRTQHPPMAAVTRGTYQLEVAVVGTEGPNRGYVYRTVRRPTFPHVGSATSWIGRWVRSATTILADRRVAMRGLAGGQVEIGIYPGFDIWVYMGYRCPAL